jgi:hypothetical protein
VQGFPLEETFSSMKIPSAITKALVGIVHKGLNVEEAIALLNKACLSMTAMRGSAMQSHALSAK